MSTTPDQRYFWIDVFRGFAILLMIPANLAPYLSEPHPMWYRAAGSFAAPMFIAISAGMVALRADRHSFPYYLKRAAAVLAVGMLIDTLLWRIFPWTSFDVLYIIGPGMLLAYAARKLKPAAVFAIAGLMFAAASGAQAWLGYDPVPFEITFDAIAFPGIGRLFASWFIDGWFPMLPWTGFIFFGAALFTVIAHTGNADGADARATGASRTRYLAAAGTGLLLLGIIGLITPIPGLHNFADGGILATRGEGYSLYSEIFYPPGFPYAATAAGIVMLALLLFRRVPHVAPFTTLSFFGRYSMMVYILHQVFGAHVVKTILTAMGDGETPKMDSGWLFLATNVAMIALIGGICALIGVVKRRYSPRNIFLRVLVGP